MTLSRAFFVSEASTTAINYNNPHMEHCNCANFQVADSRKAFSRQAACVVSAHFWFIQCCCNRVAIDDRFSRISSKTATISRLQTCLLLLLLLLFYTNSHTKMATRGKTKHATIRRMATPACMCQPLGSFYDFSVHVGRIIMPVQ